MNVFSTAGGSLAAPLVLLALPFLSVRQEASDPAGDAAADLAVETFRIEAGQHDLAELLDRAAAFLGENHLRSEADFASGGGVQFSLQNAVEVDATGCRQVVGEIAWVNQFALVPLNEDLGLYEWINLNGPRRGEVNARPMEMEPDEVLETPVLRRMVLTSVPLLSLDAGVASNALRPFFSVGSPQGQVLVGHAGDRRSLLVQGWHRQVAQTVRLLRRLDEVAREAEEDEQEERAMARILERLERLEASGGEKDDD